MVIVYAAVIRDIFHNYSDNGPNTLEDIAFTLLCFVA